jgi:hypothetical protein
VPVAQLLVVGLGPVGAVAEEHLGAALGRSASAANRRDRIDQADQLGDVVAIGRGD